MPKDVQIPRVKTTKETTKTTTRKRLRSEASIEEIPNDTSKKVVSEIRTAFSNFSKTLNNFVQKNKKIEKMQYHDPQTESVSHVDTSKKKAHYICNNLTEKIERLEQKITKLNQEKLEVEKKYQDSRVEIAKLETAVEYLQKK